MSEPGLLASPVRLRPPAATPDHWAGCTPADEGLRYPADPPTVEESYLCIFLLRAPRHATSPLHAPDLGGTA
jgi:hypothetical protein